MRKALYLSALCAALLLAITQIGAASGTFDTHFTDATLRVDYYHSGDAKSEAITIGRLYRSAPWAGSITNLIDPMNLGKYCIKVSDPASGTLLFSRYFNTIFEEYQTTEAALGGKMKTYEESVLIPFPRRPVTLSFESRQKDQSMKEVMKTVIDPADTHISSYSPDPSVEVIALSEAGDPHTRVDFSIIAEGYTEKEREKFIADAKKVTAALFTQEPFASTRERFTIRALFKASPESGCDEPDFAIFRRTPLGCSFDSLGSERYLLTERNERLHDIASIAPYDTLAILVNTKRYGGGGIYNHYATCISDSQWTNYVFIHELGHSFAGLGDEYYTSKVEYTDFYPLDREPLTPNITALLDVKNLKWKDLVTAGTKIPTPWDKEHYDKNDMRYQDIRDRIYQKLAEAKRNRASRDEIEKIEREQSQLSWKSYTQAQAILAADRGQGKVGAFEGAGYQVKGLYRPMLDCIMFSKGEKPFCRVCQDIIRKRILFLSE
ncbi:MAG: M64 family metallopeptidase [Candidatus Eremiobacteraeota bacterium]|nr:M64 family metallopeptidase [Candidatus Eremiobacteraeota bacterium]